MYKDSDIGTLKRAGGYLRKGRGVVRDVGGLRREHYERDLRSEGLNGKRSVGMKEKRVGCV